jgi:predicted nucleic acid-binding protein
MDVVVDRVPVVVDASVAVEMAIGAGDDIPVAWRAWLAEDRMILVPAVHWTEVGQALLRWSGRDAAEASQRITMLEGSGVEVADRGAAGVRMALGLAARHGLSVYDATYLWLAIDVDGALATFDRSLAAAARVEGVPLAIGP